MVRHMKLELNDPLWARIFNNLKAEYPDSFSDRKSIDMVVREQGIKIEMDLDLRWRHVELPDGDDLTMLILRWG